MLKGQFHDINFAVGRLMSAVPQAVVLDDDNLCIHEPDSSGHLKLP